MPSKFFIIYMKMSKHAIFQFFFLFYRVIFEIGLFVILNFRFRPTETEPKSGFIGFGVNRSIFGNRQSYFHSVDPLTPVLYASEKN